jgi:excinuclease ABC subunit A
VDLKIPLGLLVGVVGPSGSGKSSLIFDTLYPLILKKVRELDIEVTDYKSVEGLEHIDKIIDINQSPIGRTPRSNPATYTGLFTGIRDLFTRLPEALIRGYKPGRFSFNVKGGRCETCEGSGSKKLEMNFMPDVYIKCETCQGKRYNRETLMVRYKGKSIADVLAMTCEEALEFFRPIPKIRPMLEILNSVGLGYIQLGQSAVTLSGGEAQRLKVATELARVQTGKTLYILDEPSTGLHFKDIAMLMKILHQLVDKGNTVIVIEHNLDIVKSMDTLIEIGPEGGKNGGKIIAQGTPEEVVRNKASVTGPFLKGYFAT